VLLFFVMTANARLGGDTPDIPARHWIDDNPQTIQK